MTVTDKGIKYVIHAFWVTERNVLPPLVPSPVVFSFFLFCWLFLWVQNTKYKSGATNIVQTVFTYESSNTIFWLNWGSLVFKSLDRHILILHHFLSSTLMSFPKWNIGWLDNTNIASYTSFSQGEGDFHASNTRLIF